MLQHRPRGISLPAGSINARMRSSLGWEHAQQNLVESSESFLFGLGREKVGGISGPHLA